MTEIKKDGFETAELSMLNRIERNLVQIYIAILEIQEANTVSRLNLVTLIISAVALIVALTR